jgi:hypothetical protein
VEWKEEEDADDNDEEEEAAAARSSSSAATARAERGLASNFSGIACAFSGQMPL